MNVGKTATAMLLFIVTQRYLLDKANYSKSARATADVFVPSEKSFSFIHISMDLHH